MMSRIETTRSKFTQSSRTNAAGIFIVLICLAPFFTCPSVFPQAHAQVPIFSNQQIWQAAQLMTQQQNEYRVDKTLRLLRQYFDANQKLPGTPAEMDSFVQSSYQSITGVPVESGVIVQPDGIYRQFRDLRICYDPQVASIPQINNKWQFPANWSARYNDLVVVTDGATNYCIWLADANGKVGAIYRVGNFE